MSREAKQRGLILPDAISPTDLKICDLCGRLNLSTNQECFICGWRGHFTQDSDTVRACLDVAVRQNGRLELHHLTDPETYIPPTPQVFPGHFHSWLTRIWNWLCK